jgi:hypothetical protein
MDTFPAGLTELVAKLHRRGAECDPPVVVVEEDDLSVCIARYDIDEAVRLMQADSRLQGTSRTTLEVDGDFMRIGVPSRLTREMLSDRDALTGLGTNRRVVILVSDARGRHWYDGSIGKLLHAWGKHHLVLIVSPRQESSWMTTGLEQGSGKQWVDICHDENLTRNADLRWTDKRRPQRASSAQTRPEDFMPVPVLSLTDDGPRDLLERIEAKRGIPLVAWSRPELIQAELSAQAQEGRDRRGEQRLEGEEAVDFLFATEGPQTQQLARVLSLAAPITIPLVRQLMHLFVKKPSNSVMQGLFLGKVLRLTARPDIDPESYLYDFVPGARGPLYDALPATSRLDVFEAVERYWKAKMPDFIRVQDALARAADPTLRLSVMNLAYLRVSIRLHRALCGRGWSEPQVVEGLPDWAI